jgi:hypothetical protein
MRFTLSPAIASLALALAALAACGGSGVDCATSPTSASCTGPGGSSAPIAGNYTLKTADSKPLPAAFADSSLVSGTLVVTDSGWTQTTIVLYKTGGNPNGDTLSVSGSWEVNGANVTLFEGATTTYTGTFTSTSMTLTTKTATILGYSK